jgi:hypothetical protein
MMGPGFAAAAAGEMLRGLFPALLIIILGLLSVGGLIGWFLRGWL